MFRFCFHVLMFSLLNCFNGFLAWIRHSIVLADTFLNRLSNIVTFLSVILAFKGDSARLVTSDTWVFGLMVAMVSLSAFFVGSFFVRISGVSFGLVVIFFGGRTSSFGCLLSRCHLLAVIVFFFDVRVFVVFMRFIFGPHIVSFLRVICICNSDSPSSFFTSSFCFFYSLF